MVALDRWIVHRAHELQQKIADAYARYDFAEIVQALSNFCSVDLGALYLDVTKDRLYTMPEDSRGRRSAQSAMYRISEAFVRWIAPILSFTADEIWRHLPAMTEQANASATCCLRRGTTGWRRLADDAPLSAEDFERLLALREQVAKVLEPMRADGEIGAALDAEIALRCGVADQNRLAPMVDELRFLLISGDVRDHRRRCRQGPRGAGDADDQGQVRALLAPPRRCRHRSRRIRTSAGVACPTSKGRARIAAGSEVPGRYAGLDLTENPGSPPSRG